jgi:hypothetical protein
MAEDCLELLKNDEWRMEVALRLFDYARKLLTLDHGWSPGVMLPGGIDPENIIFDVFDRVAAGKRKFNKRFTCEVQLKGMVASIISKLYELKDATLQTIDLPEEDDNYPVVEKALGIGGNESVYEGVEFTERFFQILEEHPKVKKDSDLGLVIMAYVEGAAGPKEVAEATGIPVARIYEYNRNLTSILAEVKSKMK